MATKVNERGLHVHEFEYIDALTNPKTVYADPLCISGHSGCKFVTLEVYVDDASRTKDTKDTATARQNKVNCRLHPHTQNLNKCIIDLVNVINRVVDCPEGHSDCKGYNEQFATPKLRNTNLSTAGLSFAKINNKTHQHLGRWYSLSWGNTYAQAAATSAFFCPDGHTDCIIEGLRTYDTVYQVNEIRGDMAAGVA